METKTIISTGANSGLGFECAKKYSNNFTTIQDHSRLSQSQKAKVEFISE